MVVYRPFIKGDVKIKISTILYNVGNLVTQEY